MIDKKHKTPSFSKRIHARGESQIYFLNYLLLNRIHPDDIAWSRSFSIILSYGFEMILKSYLCLLKEKEGLSNERIEKVLVKTGHSLKMISEEIGKENLSKIGIISILKETDNSNFIKIKITTNYSIIYIEDFVQIRYDAGNMNLRKTSCRESFKKEIEEAIKISKNIKEIIHK